MPAAYGLPDRDYYTKTDAKSVEIREHYLQHVTHNFELLGESSVAAKAHAATVMAIETKLAIASLTRVEQRDPYKLKHRFTREKLAAFTPQFAWNAYSAGSELPPFTDLNIASHSSSKP